MNQPQATLAAGMQVTPSVRLVEPLGSGGMGAVWLADNTALKTKVVVKFMLGGLDSSPTARARFSREAEAAAQVKSPHVVQMFDHGVTSDGLPFIVMEHLEGRDLGVEIAARGALPPHEVITIVAQVAKALSKVHAAGLLHRDIKPDNIFLVGNEADDERFVKLLDFGIAKSHASPSESESQSVSLDAQTKTGQVVGTPFYMSPEQVTAQKVIDFRSDLWALGVVAFEALTGRRPFEGPSFGALAVKIATGEPYKPRELNPALPAAVDAWFAQACARDPEQRFASARELSDRLRAAFDGVVSLPSPLTDSGPRARSASGPSADESDEALAATQKELEKSDRSALARSEPGGAAVAIARERAADATHGSKKSSRGTILGAVALLAAVVIVSVAIGRRSTEPQQSPRPTSTSATAPPPRKPAPSIIPSATAPPSAAPDAEPPRPPASASASVIRPAIAPRPPAPKPTQAPIASSPSSSTPSSASPPSGDILF